MALFQVQAFPWRGVCVPARHPIEPWHFQQWTIWGWTQGVWLLGVPCSGDIETVGSSNIGLDNLGKGMVNLLVTNASSQSNGLISADMMVPLGTSTMSAMTSRIQWDEQRKLDDIMLLWDVRDHHYPDMWLLKAYSPFPCDSQWDFAVTDQTTLVPVTKNDSPKIHILELFAGAYGGWSSTIQYLQDFHDLDAQTISVEFDLKTCLFHAASRSTPIINGFTKLPTNLFQGFHNDLMIHADATSLDWIAPIGAWHPDIVCLSTVSAVVQGRSRCRLRINRGNAFSREC